MDTPKHNCGICLKDFTLKKDMLRHQRTIHGTYSMQCDICGVKCNRLDNLQRHRNTHTMKRKGEEDEAGPSKRQRMDTHGEYNQTCQKQCNFCGHIKELMPNKPFCERCSTKGRECQQCHRPLPERLFSYEVYKCDACHRKSQYGGGSDGGQRRTALNGIVSTSTITPKLKLDLLAMMADEEDRIRDSLEEDISTKKGIKWYITVMINFSKMDSDGTEITTQSHFRTKTKTATNRAELDTGIPEAYQELYTNLQEFQREGSGWVLDEITQLDISVAKYTPVSGSSYIELPLKLKRKKAIINVKNMDQKCLLWSVLAALYPAADHVERLNKYKPYEHELNADGLEFPTPLSQIQHFEKKNGLSINVFGYEEEKIVPLQITKQRTGTHINLLLFSDGKERHFCLIKDLNRLLSHDHSKDGHILHFCPYCLHGFCKQSNRDAHIELCSTHTAQKVEMPGPENSELYFKAYAKKLQVPFIIYADFESYTHRISESESQQTASVKYQQHIPSGFSYKVVCTHEQHTRPAVVYRGGNVVETFLDSLLEEEERIVSILSHVVPMQLTPEEEDLFSTASHCHICEKPLGIDRVRDHDHLSGAFRGAAHNQCNLNFKFSKVSERQHFSYYIPVVFHNLKGYDAHHIMSAIGKYKKKRLSCIPQTSEKYISFSMGNLRFIDSLQFLNTSLQTLVANLAASGREEESFKHMFAEFPDNTEMLLRKGVYPYDYVNAPCRLEEESLPSKDKFYSHLTEEDISVDDYDHAQKVWDTFSCHSLGEYHDLYLRSDVVLLADVFENFRQLSLSVYKLDPAHYFSSPGLSWDAMLLHTGVHLELIQDIDMFLMIENGIRGGIAMISNRYAKANNPYLADYNPEYPSSYIAYLDANNLYGWAMSQTLPFGDFQWLSEDEIASLNVEEVAADGDVGYILEVDLEYDPHLHNLHNDYPLAAEALRISDEKLSAYSKELKKTLGITGTPQKKLIPNLMNKSRYVIHISNLQLYLELGMSLLKIHRVISFQQDAWLKPYIDLNTQLRKEAKNSFERDFFKLMNNSVFGKTMENLRKRIDLELVHTKKRMAKVIAKPSFKSFNVFNENLVAANLVKPRLVLNRPIYVGFTVLELSKTLMYDFHYNYVKSKYGDNAKLLFTDTDSLCYEIKTDDLYADWDSQSDLFDFSNYPRHHKLWSDVNEKTVGKMKDETAGEPIREFVGLRSKMYSIHCGKSQKKAAKGVSKTVIKHHLRHSIYKDCLFSQRQLVSNMKNIRSVKHELYSIAQKKVSLSPYDDKRYILDNGCDTYAYGHYKIC